jgi:hypothetical protein
MTDTPERGSKSAPTSRSSVSRGLAAKSSNPTRSPEMTPVTTPKTETPRDVRIDVHHIQGYGGPDAWTVSAIDWHSNRLLEAVTTGLSDGARANLQGRPRA